MGSSPQLPADPVIGALVDGRYLVTGLIARGGMATVYRADDTRLDRVIALKVMHRSFAEDPGFVARFEHEARAAAKLSDPHVVGVFDQGTHDGLVWLAMDYVPGYTLRDVIKVHAPLDPDRALGVVEQILSGLVAAHAAGFVHRDIKPENVLMTPAGTMKITDFGLARALQSAESSTATTGLLIGTAAYLAPEQVEHGHADERTDIYATGIVLYELLTGRVPFVGPTPLAVAHRHVAERVPPPSDVIAEIPREIDGLVLRATARNPADRFSSAAEFLRAAQALPADSLETAPPASGVSASAVPGAPPQAGIDTTPTTALNPPDAAGTADGPEPQTAATTALNSGTTAAKAAVNLEANSDFTPNSVGHAAPPMGTNPTGATAPTTALAAGANSTPTAALHADLGTPPTAAFGSAPNAVPTTALHKGANAVPPSAQYGGSAARAGAAPLMPVTRRPPQRDGEDDLAVDSVKSVSRFGRTKLLVALVVLVAVVATAGWWLGMRHNGGAAATSNTAAGELSATFPALSLPGGASLLVGADEDFAKHEPQPAADSI